MASDKVFRKTLRAFHERPFGEDLYLVVGDFYTSAVYEEVSLEMIRITVFVSITRSLIEKNMCGIITRSIRANYMNAKKKEYKLTG